MDGMKTVARQATTIKRPWPLLLCSILSIRPILSWFFFGGVVVSSCGFAILAGLIGLASAGACQRPLSGHPLSTWWSLVRGSSTPVLAPGRPAPADSQRATRRTP